MQGNGGEIANAELDDDSSGVSSQRTAVMLIACCEHVTAIGSSLLTSFIFIFIKIDMLQQGSNLRYINS